MINLVGNISDPKSVVINISVQVELGQKCKQLRNVIEIRIILGLIQIFLILKFYADHSGFMFAEPPTWCFPGITRSEPLFL